MRQRSVPFYYIQTTVMPDKTALVLTDRKIAYHMIQFIDSLFDRLLVWPRSSRCRLVDGSSRLLVGHMEIEIMLRSSLSAVSDSQFRNPSPREPSRFPDVKVVNGTVSRFLGDQHLRNNGIGVVRTFLGHTSRDKTVLSLFAAMIVVCFTQEAQKTVTDRWPIVSVLSVRHITIMTGVLGVC